MWNSAGDGVIVAPKITGYAGSSIKVKSGKTLRSYDSSSCGIETAGKLDLSYGSAIRFAYLGNSVKINSGGILTVEPDTSSYTSSARIWGGLTVSSGATVKVGYYLSSGVVAGACLLNLDDDNGTATLKVYEGATLKFAAKNLADDKYSWISADHIDLQDVDASTITITLDWLSGDRPNTYDLEVLIAYATYEDDATETLPTGGTGSGWRSTGGSAPYRYYVEDTVA